MLGLWLSWQSVGCGPLGPPQEPSGQEQPTDSGAVDRLADNAPDALVDQTPTEPSAPDEGSAERQERPTEPSVGDGSDGGGESSLPERMPEPPEQGASELPPESLPPRKAKAVSLQASFLQGDLQRGLMERIAPSSARWQLEVVVPKGQHTFAFVFDGKGPMWGVATTNGAGTGVLIQTSKALSLSVSSKKRIRFSVDLNRSAWQLGFTSDASSVQIQGTWSGGAQTTPMTQQSDGSFAAALSLKQGTMTWQLSVKAGGGTQSWGPKARSHGAFPQAGVVHKNAAAGQVEIPFDGMYELRYWHPEQRWELQAAARAVDGVASWDALISRLQPISSSTTRTNEVRKWLQQRAAMGALPARKELSTGSRQATFVFVVEWKTQGPVYLAGSFNQWSTTAAPMTQLAGTDIWYRKETLNEGHHEYKFANSASPTDWILDPNNRGFVYGGLGPNSAIQVGVTPKHLLHWHKKVAATQLKNTRDVFVYLPPGYDADRSRRYPVVYMHDGQNLFDPKAIFGGWDVAGWMDRLIAQQKIQPAIIVGAANTPGRMSEYTHTQDRISGQLTGGQASAYADFLIQDLKPWIDGLYRTLPGHRTTGTMGSSLGGLISLWLGHTHPDVFFRIGALSSTFGWGQIGASNPTMLDIVKGGGWRDLVIYLDSGSPNDNYNVTLQMRDELEKMGYLHDLNLRHWTEQGASHNETEWRKRLDKPLTFLLKW